MFRCLLIMCIVLFLCSCTASYLGQNPQKQPSGTPGQTLNDLSRGSSLDGAYKFVSRTTTLTAPKQGTEQLTDAEWFGIWVFENGYFSQTRSKIDRTGWTPGHFPDSPEGIGFDGGSGTFSSHENTIELQYQTAFYPGRTGKIESLQFRLDNNILTLTEQMAPHMESLAAGQRVTVLRRIK